MSSLWGSDDSDEDEDLPGDGVSPGVLVATTAAPPIPGLFVLPTALSPDLQHRLALDSTSLFTNNSNQVMLFKSAHPAASAFPAFLEPLFDEIPRLIAALPVEVQHILIPPPSVHHQQQPNQIIINLYRGAQGISPHVDLLQRFGDGIIGFSFLGGTVMEFARVGSSKERHAAWLPPGSAYVLTGEARFGWTHEIREREWDWYTDGSGEVTKARRRIRLSITVRRMLAGADLVGNDEQQSVRG